MLRRVFSVLTTLGVLTAFAVAVIWFATSQPGTRWEPATSCLSLLAAFTGIFAERWAAAAARRERALRAVLDEALRNQKSFAALRGNGDTRAAAHPRVYPRFADHAGRDALRHGVLTLEKDDPLRQLLYSWVSICEQLNHRLDLTEMLVFTTPTHTRIAQFGEALHRKGGLLDQASTINDELMLHMGPQ